MLVLFFFFILMSGIPLLICFYLMWILLIIDQEIETKKTKELFSKKNPYTINIILVFYYLGIVLEYESFLF